MPPSAGMSLRNYSSQGAPAAFGRLTPRDPNTTRRPRAGCGAARGRWSVFQELRAGSSPVQSRSVAVQTPVPLEVGEAPPAGPLGPPRPIPPPDPPGPPAPIPFWTAVTAKLLLNFTVTCVPSALVMCASYVAPSAS